MQFGLESDKALSVHVVFRNQPLLQGVRKRGKEGIFLEVDGDGRVIILGEVVLLLDQRHRRLHLTILRRRHQQIRARVVWVRGHCALP